MLLKTRFEFLSILILLMSGSVLADGIVDEQECACSLSYNRAPILPQDLPI